MLTQVLSWLDFVLFSVLPIAFNELIHWLYDWQVLIAGILAIVAARIWGKSVVRGARIAAAAQMPASVAPRAQAAPAPSPAAPPRPAPRPVPAASAAAAGDPLLALRETIRATLAAIPYSDEPLTPERMTLCSRVLQYPVGDAAAKAGKVLAPKYEVLQKELGALGEMGEKNTCRNAWQVLVRINDAARDLIEASSGPRPPR